MPTVVSKQKKQPPIAIEDSLPVGLGQDVLTVGLLSGLSVFLLWMIFPPRGWWPLAFVALTPWSFAVCHASRPWVAHWGSFLFGFAFFLVSLSWLEPVTGLGFVALAFYLAIYWPMAAWGIRTGRRAGVSVVWTLPVIWVACEFLRGWVMTGFPWLFVAHAFYKQTLFIQVSDITGAYGVTFLAVLVSGVLAEFALRHWRLPGEPGRWKNAITGGFVALLLIGGSLAYGKLRLGQTDQAVVDGPRVAVIQEDFPLESTPPYGEHPYVVFARYVALAAEAAREKPDLIAFPESVWSATQNIDFLEIKRQAVDEAPAATWWLGDYCHRATAAFARGDYASVNQIIAHFERRLAPATPDDPTPRKLPRLPAEGGPAVTVLLGSMAREILPEEVSPREKHFNSTLVYDADGTQRRKRYDKIHLVPFGEIVPFRNAHVLGVDMHWLYRFLNRLSPFSRGGTIEYSFWPGDKYTVFDLNTGGKTWRFGTPICYEDSVPSVIRSTVWDRGERRVDFLVNVSNDGWFMYSDELPQHLATCVFRAVENRVGIARAVNTGISGFIDSNGQIYSLVEKDGNAHGRGIIGYRIASVRVDSRSSFYGRHGDWFALVCLLGAGALWLGAVVTRWVFSLRQKLRAWRFGKGGQ